MCNRQSSRSLVALWLSGHATTHASSLVVLSSSLGGAERLRCCAQLAAELLYQLAASPDTQAPTLDALRREGALTAQLDLLCRPLPKDVRRCAMRILALIAV